MFAWFWFLVFGGFILYWFFDALVLQWSSKIVVKAKPDYWHAFGLTALVYLVEVVIVVLAFFFAFLMLGRMSMMDLLHSNFSAWFSLIPGFILYTLISLILFALLVGWIYGKMLRDEEGRQIGLAKGLLVFLLQFVITRVLLSILALVRIAFVGSCGMMF